MLSQPTSERVFFFILKPKPLIGIEGRFGSMVRKIPPRPTVGGRPTWGKPLVSTIYLEGGADSDQLNGALGTE
jgi:hypothetical protein